MRGLGLLVVVLATACALVDSDPAIHHQGEISKGDRATKQQLETDLHLLVELNDHKTIQAGTQPWVCATLVNTSKTVTHRVVRPGDGSEVGWREPYVYWTATVDCGDGKPVPLPETDYARCGLFSWDWQKDAIRLEPGAKLPLNSFQLLTFQRAGRVHLCAHYAYREGKGPQSRSPIEPGKRGLMVGVPSFEIISAPVVFDVVRPLDVRVKVKRALKVDHKTRLSDLIEVVLVNQSQETIQCVPPTLYAEARLHLEIRGTFGGWRPAISDERTANGVCRDLKPGKSIALLGVGDFANGLDGYWEYPVEDTVKLRAVYTTTTWKPGASIQSDWVEVAVEK